MPAPTLRAVMPLRRFSLGGLHLETFGIRYGDNGQGLIIGQMSPIEVLGQNPVDRR